MKLTLNSGMVYTNVDFATRNSIDGTLVVELSVQSIAELATIVADFNVSALEVIQVEDDNGEPTTFTGYTYLASVGFNGLTNKVTLFLKLE